MKFHFYRPGVFRPTCGALLVLTLLSSPLAFGQAASEIKLTGISGISGKKKVLLLVRDSSSGQSRSHILSEGETEGGVEVLKIDERAGLVRIKNAGKEMDLSFSKDGIPVTAPVPAVAVNPIVSTPPPAFSAIPPPEPPVEPFPSADSSTPERKPVHVFGANSRRVAAPDNSPAPTIGGPFANTAWRTPQPPPQQPAPPLMSPPVVTPIQPGNFVLSSPPAAPAPQLPEQVFTPARPAPLPFEWPPGGYGNEPHGEVSGVVNSWGGSSSSSAAGAWMMTGPPKDNSQAAGFSRRSVPWMP